MRFRGLGLLASTGAAVALLFAASTASAATISLDADASASGDIKHQFNLPTIGSVDGATSIWPTTCKDLTDALCNLNPASSFNSTNDPGTTTAGATSPISDAAPRLEFAEYFLIDIGVDGQVAGVVTINAFVNVNIFNLTATLYTSTSVTGTIGTAGSSVSYDDTLFASATLLSPGQFVWTINLDSVDSPFVLRVTGDRTTTDAQYEINTALTPLPPAAILLVSAVVGIAGVGLRRRKAARV